MSKRSIKVNEKEFKGTKDGKEVSVKIRTKEGKEQPVEFDEVGKGKKSKEKVEFEYKIKEGDKEWPKEWTSFKSEVEWTGGWVANGMKLTEKKPGGVVELKEDVEANTGFFGTPTKVCWVAIVFIFFSLIALIWWWVASGKNKDEEEEGL